MPRAFTESAKFVIKTAGDNRLSFEFKGSVVGSIVEAFTWLEPARREKLLTRLQAKQTELLAKEAEKVPA